MENVVRHSDSAVITYFLLEEYYITWPHTVAADVWFSCSPIKQEYGCSIHSITCSQSLKNINIKWLLCFNK